MNAIEMYIAFMVVVAFGGHVVAFCTVDWVQSKLDPSKMDKDGNLHYSKSYDGFAHLYIVLMAHVPWLIVWKLGGFFFL